jgi:hypothetical protein
LARRTSPEAGTTTSVPLVWNACGACAHAPDAMAAATINAASFFIMCSPKQAKKKLRAMHSFWCRVKRDQFLL